MYQASLNKKLLKSQNQGQSQEIIFSFFIIRNRDKP